MGLVTFIVYKIQHIQKSDSHVYVTPYSQSVIPTATSKPSFIRVPEVALDRIISQDHSVLSSLPKESVWTMMVTGDVIPARSVNTQTIKRGDFTWPFLETGTLLKTADITVVNLETPLLSSCNQTDCGMVFCGDARHIEGLTFAGVDLASFSNNHAANYGSDGVAETKKLLESNGISVFGLGSKAIKTMKGTRIAFLGYNDVGVEGGGVASASAEYITRDIKSAKIDSDLVVVAFHWGIEYQTQPTKHQIELGHLAIDSGADLVIGNHPHWIEPVEVYKDKVIMYAHGNFVFDQMWSEETKLGVIGKYTFYGKQLVDVEFFPIKIFDYGQPKFLDGEEKTKILNQLFSASSALKDSLSKNIYQ